MYVVSDMSDPKTVRHVPGEIVKTDKNGFVKLSDGEWYMGAYVFPDAAANRLISLVEHRAALKKAYDDSMSLVYVLRNDIAREDAA